MVIIHEPAQGRFYTTVDGYTAHVSYRIENGGLDIRHTIVPEEIGGRGIASELVKATYDYAIHEGLRPVATCRFAVIWLSRHPEYKGTVSPDWHPGKDCAL
ncbi:MAG: N-acetyltransferase [Bacteroidetes bacterium]|uniref:N-acetyltransferase n=1 Tax=Candidatus Cryptobacteroides excrementipullorum TaxID=2840761 RepID=A0A9D9ISL2_9BACT|nr:N-acetyltransferase [Candidatus Cryptobacteroides excrementipullorum]